jgi:hypothetical protein
MLIPELLMNVFELSDKFTQFNIFRHCVKHNKEAEIKYINRYFMKLKKNKYRIPYNEIINDPDFIIFYQDFISFNVISIYDTIIPNHLHMIKPELINWDMVVYSKKIMNIDFLMKYQGKINWDRFSYNKKIPSHIIVLFDDFINWDNLCLHDPKQNFIKKYEDRINWKNVSFTSLQHYMIYRNMDIDWDDLVINRYLPEWFIRKVLDKLNWNYVVLYQYSNISEDFIRDYEKDYDMSSLLYMRRI